MNAEQLRRYARLHPWQATVVVGAGMAVLAYGGSLIRKQNVTTFPITAIRSQITRYAEPALPDNDAFFMRHSGNPLYRAYGYGLPDYYQETG